MAQSGVIILHENKDVLFKKTKIEQHEITKGQNKRKTGLKWRKIYKKGKILTLLENDTNLGSTIAPKKGFISPANRIWILPKPTKPLDK